MLFRKLPANAAGRDFIMGDLHGCLDLLEAELARLGFDPAVDRLFSVGDLVDRGPDSMGCLRLLREPWFHAVRGNHEDMLLAYFQEKGLPEASRLLTEIFLRNGGAWVQALDAGAWAELLEDLLPRVQALPYVMTIGDGIERFNIVHAELLTGTLEPDGLLARWAGRTVGGTSPTVLTDELLNDDTLADMSEPLAWGRRLIKRADMKAAAKVETPCGVLLLSAQAMRPGLSLTYVGHTPQEQMVLHQSHLFIDRGAYKREAGSCLLVLDHGDVLAWIRR